MYCIQPNYHTVHLGFSKLLENYLLQNVHLIRAQFQGRFHRDFIMDYSMMLTLALLFLLFLIKAYAVGTPLNYLNKSMCCWY